ncbi:hypothetical protein QWY75_04120 [Pontixanthobacter aestiaquae]|uniref:hypothetical protein n=1 Tax=Pontixanthobacter aestiaquae TaxID=1509367 RepID=UPI0019290932|nr:hypothetical protein [Pontixanthobacter aestiaquae]MDN3645394.1 hypothetical protein [Pontixanthobacter aestiaquae]
MSQFQWIHIIWAFGALLLLVSALAAYRLSWKTSLLYALIWASIFTAGALLFSLFGT